MCVVFLFAASLDAIQCCPFKKKDLHVCKIHSILSIVSICAPHPYQLKNKYNRLSNLTGAEI
jgi:hypothetical protein